MTIYNQNYIQRSILLIVSAIVKKLEEKDYINIRGHTQKSIILVVLAIIKKVKEIDQNKNIRP